MATATKNETALERQVREEQEAHDAAEVEPRRQNVETDKPAETVETDDGDQGGDVKDPPEAKPGEQAAAFDPSQYDREDLQIPKIDGQTIDRISIKWSGEVFLDRSDPSDVAVYNALRLGKDVSLLIEAKCSQTAAKGATDRDGDLDVVVGTKGLKVHSLQKPAGADWVEPAGGAE